MRRAALLLLVAAALGLEWKALPGRTPAITGPDPITVLEPVQIGGMTQWLLIRGQDRRAPVLLWLHGGAGGGADAAGLCHPWAPSHSASVFSAPVGHCS